MVVYTCNNCGKEFLKKSHYIDHTENKKKPCRQNDRILPNFTQKLPKNYPKLPNFTQNQETNSDQEDKYIYHCQYCDKKYIRKEHLKRHIENSCKAKPKVDLQNVNINNVDTVIDQLNIDEQTKTIFTLLLNQNKKLVKEIEQVKEENITKKSKELVTHTNTNTSNSNSNNTTNMNSNNTNNNLTNNNLTNNLSNTTNINIIAHGTDELKNIELGEIIKYLSTSEFVSIIPKFAKHIYMNDSKPENKNFYVTDISRDSCKLHNGKKWIRAKASEKINKMLNNLQVVLTDPFEKENIKKTLEYIETNKKLYNDKFIRWAVNYLNNLENEDDKDNIENKKKILEELKLVFYNNKEEILNM